MSSCVTGEIMEMQRAVRHMLIDFKQTCDSEWDVLTECGVSVKIIRQLKCFERKFYRAPYRLFPRQILCSGRKLLLYAFAFEYGNNILGNQAKMGFSYNNLGALETERGCTGSHSCEELALED